MRAARVLGFVLCCGAVGAVPRPVEAQSQQAVAQSRFNKGRELFIAGNYRDAVTEFRAATELLESPNTRLYIARCERELGHFARAYVEYQRAETEAADRSASDARYASTRDAARQESGTIASKLGHLVLKGDALPKDVTLTIAGVVMGAAALGVPMPVDPGQVELGASARGFKPLRKSAEVRAGQQTTVTLTLEREAAREPELESGVQPSAGADTQGRRADPAIAVHRSGGGVRTAGFVVSGAGAVGVGLFGTFAGLAQSRFSQLQSECGTHCGASYQPRIDTGKQYQLVANVSLAAGATLLVGGAIMIATGGASLVTTRSDSASVTLPLIGPTADGRGLNVGIMHAF